MQAVGAQTGRLHKHRTCVQAQPWQPLSRLPLPRTLRCCATEPEGASVKTQPMKQDPLEGSFDMDQVRLRSEVEAPWRSVRFVLFGFSVVSAGVGLLVSVPQLIGALGNAPNALPLEQVVTNLGINAGAVGVFSFLLFQDIKARDKQMARLTREESLSSCGVELSNGKRLSLGSLRGSVRVVVIAGTNTQIREALDAADPYKAELQRRGVLVVTAPIYEAPGEGDALPALTKEDLRWRAAAIKLDAWRSWFSQQLSLSSKATPEKGLYLSLRKDGRVRGSGMGRPPWAQLAAQLPPEEGMWTGLLDGMDGKV